MAYKKIIKSKRAKTLLLDILVLYLNIIFFLPGCEDVFQYSPNQVRLKEEERNLNAKNIEKISEARISGSDFKFALIGDTQRFYDDAEDFVSHINQRDNIAFILLAGDISDFGQEKEFKWVHRMLNNLKAPYIAVIGNHDMLANGTKVYEQMYGPLNFAFTCNNYKFICLNTNSREAGLDGSVPDMEWLKRQLNDTAGVAGIFTVSHIPPFDGDFDKNLEAAYTEALAGNGKVKMSLHGHQHKYKYFKPYADSISYLVAGGMAKRNYAIISIKGEAVEVEEVTF